MIKHLNAAIIVRTIVVVVASLLLLAAAMGSRQDRRQCDYFGPPDVTCAP